MTPQELDLLAGILLHCDRATLAFCLADDFPGRSFLAFPLVAHWQNLPAVPATD